MKKKGCFTFPAAPRKELLHLILNKISFSINCLFTQVLTSLVYHQIPIYIELMSWFQSTGLNSAFDTLTETVQKAKETVQDAIPTEHKELLAKLTLNTDEMISERQNFRDEATRKEQAKNRLDKLLPWETSIKNYEVRSFGEENAPCICSFLPGLNIFFSLFKNKRYWWKNARKQSWNCLLEKRHFLDLTRCPC